MANAVGRNRKARISQQRFSAQFGCGEVALLLPHARKRFKQMFFTLNGLAALGSCVTRAHFKKLQLRQSAGATSNVCDT